MTRSNGGNGNSYFDLVLQTVSVSDTAVVLRAALFLTSQPVSDGTNNLSVSGAGTGGLWSRSGTLALSGSYSGTLVWSQDVTLTRLYGQSYDVTASASWSSVEFWGTTLSATTAPYTIPARPWDPPAAPSSVAVSRVSDAQHTVTWVNNATSTAPYEVLNVRRSTDAGPLALIASLPGSATSYTDTTGEADRDYLYEVTAGNSSGAAAAATGHIQTTPAAPFNVQAIKTAGTGIQVSWSNGSRLTPITWSIERSSDGGAWTGVASGLAQGTSTWTDPAPSAAQAHKYRVRAESTEGASTQSAWAESGTVQLAAPPAAPTGLATTPNPLPASEAGTLAWVHNPVDSSPQRRRHLRWRKQGTSTWTEGTITDTASQSVAFASLAASWGAANGETWEWAVRTWGQATTGGSDGTGASPWSATSTVTLSSRPTASINVPGASVTTSRLTVTWGYFDAEGSAQTAWQAELQTPSSAVIEALSGSGDAASVTFATTLEDGASYKIGVRVRDGAGLWSLWADQVITVSYAKPPAPVVTAAWDPDTASVTLDVATPPETGAQVQAVSVDVYRSIDSGPWTLIAADLPITTTVVDHSPTVAGSNRYRADAVSALPSVQASTVVEVLTPAAGDPPASVWLSGGPGLSVMCRARSNVALASRSGRAEKVLHRFAGRALPVEFTGEGVARSWGLSFDIIRDSAWESSPADEWLDLADLPGPHLLRTPDHYRWVSLSDVNVNRGVGGVVSSVSLTVTEVDRD